MPPTMKAAATALMVRNVFQVKVGGFRQLPGRIQESRGKNLPLESELGQLRRKTISPLLVRFETQRQPALNAGFAQICEM